MQAKLVYHLDLGVQNAADPKFQAKASGININQGSFDWLGVSVVSAEVSVESENVLLRTITLETTPFGDTLWKSPDQLAYATRNLLNEVYSLRMPANVKADEPVITP